MRKLKNPILSYKAHVKLSWSQLAPKLDIPYATLLWLSRRPPLELSSTSIGLALQLKRASNGKLDIYGFVDALTQE